MLGFDGDPNLTEGPDKCLGFDRGGPPGTPRVPAPTSMPPGAVQGTVAAAPLAPALFCLRRWQGGRPPGLWCGHCGWRLRAWLRAWLRACVRAVCVCGACVCGCVAKMKDLVLGGSAVIAQRCRAPHGIGAVFTY